MKQKDLTLIALTALVAAVFSIILSGVLFGSPKKNPIKVPVVDKISSSFPSVQTDDNYKTFFNSNALDPTQLIQIGGSSNTNPFQGSDQ
jgi:hypothetical protein